MNTLELTVQIKLMCAKAHRELCQLQWAFLKVHYALERMTCWPGDLVRLNPNLLRRMK
jgi:hypothetical protein